MNTDVSLTEQLLTIFANKKRIQQTFKETGLSHLKVISEKLGEYIEQREKTESEKIAAQEEAKGMLKSIMEKTGLSHEEIATLMDLAPKTVNNHIVLALQHLRSHLKEFQDRDTIVGDDI